MKKAIFAGSFDPLTLGHIDLICRAEKLFGNVIVAVAQCSSKNVLPVEKRVDIIKASLPDIEVKSFDGMLTDFLKKEGAGILVRGLRTAADYEYEKNLECIYKKFADLEVCYLMSSPQLSCVSSSAVREILRAGGDISGFVDTKAEKMIRDYYSGGFGYANKRID